jgi:hypothetical protein
MKGLGPNAPPGDGAHWNSLCGALLNIKIDRVTLGADL